MSTCPITPPVWVASSLAALVGAPGAGLEGDDAIRAAAYVHSEPGTGTTVVGHIPTEAVESVG